MIYAGILLVTWYGGFLMGAAIYRKRTKLVVHRVPYSGHAVVKSARAVLKEFASAKGSSPLSNGPVRFSLMARLGDAIRELEKDIERWAL